MIISIVYRESVLVPKNDRISSGIK